MDLLDLIFDYKHISKVLNNDLDFEHARDDYKNHHIPKCVAPNGLNSSFIFDAEEVQAKNCKKFGAWLEPITTQSFSNYLKPYLSVPHFNEKLQLFVTNINEEVKSAPINIEKLLPIITEVYKGRGTNIYGGHILNAFATKSDYQFTDSTIIEIETFLNQSHKNSYYIKNNIIKSSSTILTNYVTHYSQNISHCNFLVDLATRDNFDANSTNAVALKFSNDVKESETWHDIKVFNCFEDFLEHDTKAHHIAVSLVKGVNSYDYLPSLKALSYFEDLLEISEHRDAALQAITESYLKFLADPAVELNFDEVELKLLGLLKKVEKLPSRLVEAVFEYYIKDQTHFSKLILEIVADDKVLPTTSLATKPLLDRLVKSVFNNIETDQTKIQDALFIMLRLAQHQANFPAGALNDIKFLGEDNSNLIKIRAVNLYYELGKYAQLGIELIDPLIAFLPQVSIEQGSKIQAILSKLALRPEQAQNLNLATDSKQNTQINIAQFNVSSLNVSAIDKGVLKSSTDLLQQLGWDFDLLSAVISNNTGINSSMAICTLEKLANYNVTGEVLNRHGLNSSQILDSYPPQDWLPEISRLIRDNHFYLERDLKTLLDNFENSNTANKHMSDLSDENFFEIQIQKSNLIGKNGVEYKKKTNFKQEASLSQDPDDSNPGDSNPELTLDAKPLENWDNDNFLTWRKAITFVNDDNIAEVMAVLDQAVYKTYGYHLRSVQILSVLTLFKSTSGGLDQIATGEGKTIIIAVFAAIKVLNGLLVDIMSSSGKLAAEDAEDMELFYSLFGITSAHNTKFSAGPKECYKADIVYGDAINFIGDMLRDLNSNTKLGRGFAVLIIDEVDNILIDQVKMKVQLSGFIPGFDKLRQVLVYMWSNGITYASNFEQKEDGCYLNPPVPNEAEIKDIEELNNSTLDEYNKTLSDYIKTEGARVNQSYSCIYFIKEFLRNFTIQEIFAFEQKIENRLVLIPEHMKEFSKYQLTNWLNSFEDALWYKQQKIEYVVYDPDGKGRYNFKLIAPLDAQNTGAVQKELTWNDGLHQYLQLKHRLVMYNENTISIFMSYHGYVSKYKGSIYGVTGTLGDETHHEFLNQLYNVNTTLVPNFIQKDLVIFPTIITDSKLDWQAEIVESIIRTTLGSRAVLVIVEELLDTEILREALINAGYDPGKIRLYGSGSKDEANIEKVELKPADVIIATNLAGRGTDLKLSPQLIKNGGLHVILGSLPHSVRVQDQAFGRSARHGEPGSAQMIINLERLDDNDCYNDIGCLTKHRDLIDAQSVEENQFCTIPEMHIRDKLFNLYIEMQREANSPTGYKLVVNSQNGTKPTNQTVYLEQKNELGRNATFLKIVKTTVELSNLDITDLIVDIDPKAANHIAKILSNPHSTITSLNKQYYELLHFIVTQYGFSEHPIIYERAVTAYIKEVYKFEKSNQISYGKYNINTFKESNQWYLKSLYYPHKTAAELKTWDPSPGELVELNKGLTRSLFRLWRADQEVFNNEFETSQITEFWAIWFKQHENEITIDYDCKNLTNSQKEEIRNLTTTQWAKLQDSFDGFKNVTLKLHNDKQLMKNPTYLVQKAWRYLQIHFQQEVANEDITFQSTQADDSGIMDGILTQVSTIFKPDNKEIRQEVKAVNVTLLQQVDHVITVVEDVVEDQSWGGFASNLYQTFYQTILNLEIVQRIYAPFMPNFNNYKVDKALNDALEYLNKAESLDPQSWVTANTKGYIQLVKEGSNIFHQDQGNDAERIKANYANDANEAIKRINDYVLPALESQVVSLLMNGLVNYTDDTAVQLLGTVKFYKNIIDFLAKNIETIQRTEPGKQMVRMGNWKDIQVIADSVNITEAVYDFLSRTADSDLTSSIVLKTITAKHNFTGSQVVVSEINLSGGLLFELSVYALEEPEKESWLNNIFIGVMGVGQIFLGMAIISMGGVFAGSFGMSLIMQGVGDIMMAGISLTQGTAIPLDSYFKSKGISIAISIATAGVLHMARGMEAFQFLNNADMINKVQSNPSLFIIKAAAINAAGMLAGNLIYNTIGNNQIDEGDIEEDAKQKAAAFLEAYKNQLQLILATDAWFNNNGLMNLLVSRSSAIASQYMNKFHDDGTRFKVGVATNVAASIPGMGGLANGMGQAFDMAATGSLGAIKSARAFDSIIGGVRGEVDLVVRGAMSRWQMMADSLQQAFPGDATELSTALVGQGYMIRVNDRNCDMNGLKLEDVKLSGNQANYKTQGLKDLCEAVQKHMSQHYSTDLYKQALVKILVDTKTLIQKYDIAKPLSNSVASAFAQKAAEVIERKLNEMKQQSQTAEKAEDDPRKPSAGKKLTRKTVDPDEASNKAGPKKPSTSEGAGNDGEHSSGQKHTNQKASKAEFAKFMKGEKSDEFKESIKEAEKIIKHEDFDKKSVEEKMGALRKVSHNIGKGVMYLEGKVGDGAGWIWKEYERVDPETAALYREVGAEIAKKLGVGVEYIGKAIPEIVKKEYNAFLESTTPEERTFWTTFGTLGAGKVADTGFKAFKKLDKFENVATSQLAGKMEGFASAKNFNLYSKFKVETDLSWAESYNGWLKNIDASKLQAHHVLSNKGKADSAIRNNKLFQEGLLDVKLLDSDRNLMPLPTKAGMHPTMNVHAGGRHTIKYHAKMNIELDEIRIAYRNQIITKDQIEPEFWKVVNKEKTSLFNGESNIYNKK